MLIPDFAFPVYKIDREQSERKNVSKVRLRIPKSYSEAVVFETFIDKICDMSEEFLKLQTRTMKDNLLFTGIPETADETRG